jgi:DNA mismatch repair protein MutS
MKRHAPASIWCGRVLAMRQTLLAAVDACVTAAGTRKLADQLSAPLTDRDPCPARCHRLVSWRMPTCAGSSRRAFRHGRHVAGAVARDAWTGRAARSGRAGDQRSIKPVWWKLCCPTICLPCSDSQNSARRPPHGLASRLVDELSDSPPLLARDGGFVAKGVDSDLDAARSLRDDARKVIAGLQATYSAQTQAKSLKIKHNGVLGYFIEVPALQAGPLQEQAETFFHRQTMANAMRFSTRNWPNWKRRSPVPARGRLRWKWRGSRIFVTPSKKRGLRSKPLPMRFPRSM